MASLGGNSPVEVKGDTFTSYMPRACSGLEIEHACLAPGGNQTLTVRLALQTRQE